MGAKTWPSVLKFTRGVPPTGLAQRNTTMKSARTHGKQHEVEDDDGVPSGCSGDQSDAVGVDAV